MTPTNNALPELLQWWWQRLPNLEPNTAAIVEELLRGIGQCLRASAGREAVAWRVEWDEDDEGDAGWVTLDRERGAMGRANEAIAEGFKNVRIRRLVYDTPTAPELPKQGEGGGVGNDGDAEELAQAVEGARSHIGPRRPDDADDALFWDRLTRAANVLRALAKKAEGS